MPIRPSTPRSPRRLPGHVSFDACDLRARIVEVIEDFVPARTLLTMLGRSNGVILGSVAHHVALPNEDIAPTGVDIAVDFEGFDIMFSFLEGLDLECSSESVSHPWSSTAESVHVFRHKRKRRIGPGLPRYLYVRLIRLKTGSDTLYFHLLSSPTTSEMTYLTPSSWVTFYPMLWQARVSWYRWSDTVNQYIRDKRYSARNAGFKLVNTNATHTGTCTSCPASTHVLSGNDSVYVVTHSLARRRTDVHGTMADRLFKDISIKWKFSVHCFNSNCCRYQAVTVREPNRFFAPSSQETIDCNTDEHCNYKIAWISSLRVLTYHAIMLRPNQFPNLVPVFIEPTEPHYRTIDSVAVEQWFARTGGEVWSLKSHRLLRSDVEDGAPDVMYTLFVSPGDSVNFDRYHEDTMLLVKHTDSALLSFDRQDLEDIKRYVYEWLDPTLADSDNDAGRSDCYADPLEI
ncbi:hypothetical protein K435DRAFT_875354 [Dendrothele bispora CBS 962.96]|uniref:Uncharacterized protein n=1 Tax=Dendrothele bispora (strain CBS 962.96) TaxID=1314807 RepID=A0A4S8KVN3_DENBC|nr:hypothetical protein K435DRAFT_875354 [Dendrothele bispora CBS 962.96]